MFTLSLLKGIFQKKEKYWIFFLVQNFQPSNVWNLTHLSIQKCLHNFLERSLSDAAATVVTDIIDHIETSPQSRPQLNKYKTEIKFYCCNCGCKKNEWIEPTLLGLPTWHNGARGLGPSPSGMIRKVQNKK